MNVAVGIRELKDRLSEYLRRVRQGQGILVTDHGQVIAEIRKPGAALSDSPVPRLLIYAEQGKARLGAPNQPDLYPALSPCSPPGTAGRLLDEERGER